MTRSRVYTDEYYEDAIQAAWDRIATAEYYTKAQILERAGFEADQRQHWARLRRAAGRLGLPLVYTEEGWTRGVGGQVVHEWDKRMRRNAKSMRQNIIGHLQKADGAQQAVKYLLEQDFDPLAAPVVLRAYGAGLPRDVTRELAAATMAMLPGLAEDVRDTIQETARDVQVIAGLLGPSGRA